MGDLPMEDAEGIAVDNLVDPPMIYLFTDPSSPHGKQYIAAMFSFKKPKEGSGLMYDASSQEYSSPVYCDGCNTVWEYLEEISTFISSGEMSSRSHSRGRPVLAISLSSSLAVLVVLFLVTVSATFLFLRWRRSKKNGQPDASALESSGDSYESSVDSHEIV